jgi:hypothetical protein
MKQLIGNCHMKEEEILENVHELTYLKAHVMATF